MVKTLFCDLDGTLWEEDFENHDFLIKEKDMKSLQIYYNNGGKIIITTGRGEKAIRILEQKCGITLDSYIGANGGYIWQKGEVVYSASIDAKTVVKALAGLSVHATAYYHVLSGSRCIKYLGGDDQCLLAPCPEVEEHYFETREDRLYKVTLVVNSDIQREIIRQKIKDSGFPLRTIVNQLGYVEILPIQVSKGEAIKKYCELNHLNVDEIAFIGDAENDIEGMKIAGYSFCMNKSSAEIQRNAKMVVEDVSSAIQVLL